jgi:hypothetical protein
MLNAGYSATAGPVLEVGGRRKINMHPAAFRGRLKQIVWQHKRYSYEPYRIVTIRLNSA